MQCSLLNHDLYRITILYMLSVNQVFVKASTCISFRLRKEKMNWTMPGLGCMEGLTLHCPLLYSKPVQRLRMCGLGHCHAVDGRVLESTLLIFY